MSTRIRTTAAVLGVTALLGGGVAVSQAFAAAAAPTAADADVASTLTFAREEERMARDLYAALAQKYDDARPFSMVTRSEQQHFDAVGALLTRYEVSDPAAGKPAGTYADPTVQKLYDGWLAKGNTSLEAAYQVGVDLEKRDIADLERSIAGDLPSDVDAVFGHLLQASEHHLAAYQRAVDGDLGTGPGMMNGNGPGRGAGMMGGRFGNGQGRGPGNGPGMNGGDCPYADSTPDSTT